MQIPFPLPEGRSAAQSTHPKAQGLALAATHRLQTFKTSISNNRFPTNTRCFTDFKPKSRQKETRTAEQNRQSDAQTPNRFCLVAIHSRAPRPVPQPQGTSRLIEILTESLGKSGGRFCICGGIFVVDYDAIEVGEGSSQSYRDDDEGQEE